MPPSSDSPPSPTRERGVLLLVAEDAGGAEREAVDAVTATLREEGVDVREHQSSGLDGLRGALDARDSRVPVACGGDGSIHLLLQGLHAREELGETPVGLVPLGTGNDLAGAMGLPEDPADAARVVAAGRVRTLDVAMDDDGRLVVNAAHVGVGVVATERGETLKPVLGPWAYQLGGLLAGVRPPRWRARVTVDGRVVHEGMVLVVAAGVGHRVGGGTPLLPGAAHDDGLLDVVVAHPEGLLARIGAARDLAAGTHLTRDDVQVYAGREVTVEAPSGAPALPLNVDGEVLGDVRRRTWSLRRSAWELLVP